jgi:glycosyltransferase involved in cell wall biosynthesis
MRLLHIIPSISRAWGGPVTTLNNLIEVWQINGFFSDVLTIHEDKALVPIASKVIQVSPNFPIRYSNSSEAIRWLATNLNNYDIFIIHGIWSIINLRAARFLRLKKKKYLVISHGSLDPFDLQKKRFAKNILGPLIIRPFLAGAAGALCSTQLEARLLVTYGANIPISFIPWPIEPEVFLIDRLAARTRYGYSETDFVILFLGRIDYKKGFPILLPAFRSLCEKTSHARLVIVGPDTRDYKSKVKQMIKDLGIAKNVLLLDHVSGKAKSEMFQMADCFVLPSLNENYGNAVIEAMQHGLPVVISRNVYIFNEVLEAGAGLVCGYDESSLLSCLQQLEIDVALRLQLSQRAREYGYRVTPRSLAPKFKVYLETVRSY